MLLGLLAIRRQSMTKSKTTYFVASEGGKIAPHPGWTGPILCKTKTAAKTYSPKKEAIRVRLVKVRS